MLIQPVEEVNMTELLKGRDLGPIQPVEEVNRTELYLAVIIQPVGRDQVLTTLSTLSTLTMHQASECAGFCMTKERNLLGL